MIWFTSDWHFGHDREFIWKPRGFTSIQEHDERIIIRHNNLVAPDDDVYVLGDLMLGDNEHGLDCIRRMKGKLHIIRGNHDTDRRIELYRSLPAVVEICDAKYLRERGYHFFLSHYPSLTGNLEKESLKQMTCNIFGHTHQKAQFYNDIPYMVCVCMDALDCFPLSIGEIISKMQSKVKECKAFLDEEQESPAVAKVKHDRRMIEANWDLYSYEVQNCDKCVWQGRECSGPVLSDKIKCPTGITYKRDPPDGGYYD